MLFSDSNTMYVFVIETVVLMIIVNLSTLITKLSSVKLIKKKGNFFWEEGGDWGILLPHHMVIGAPDMIHSSSQFQARNIELKWKITQNYTIVVF